MSCLPMFLRVLRGWVCLYYLATQVAASGDWRPKAILGVPIGGLATRGQARSGHFATLEEAGTGLEGWPPTSV